MTNYTSQYPPAQNETYVKATTYYSTVFYPHYTTDPSRSLTGTWNYNSWVSQDGVRTNQRFHIDLGSGKIIRRIYYENAHLSGGRTTAGAKNFTFWGSNEADAFSTLTYATDTDWTQLTTSQSTLDQHVEADQADHKYITVTNTTAYRYYAFKFADNYGYTYMSVRRIELQTEDGAVAPFISGAMWF